MSRSATKTQIALIHTKRNRMIPRFSLMRSGGWRSFAADLDTNRPIPPKEPGAAEPRERRDQQAAASGTTKPARGTPGCTARPVHHPGPADRRLRPAGAPVDGAGTVRVAKDSQGSDLPVPRRAGKALPASPPARGLRPAGAPVDGAALSASPPAHKTPTYRYPSNGIEHRSRLAPRGSPPRPCLRSHDTQTSQK